MKKIAKYLFAALGMTAAVSCAQELTEDFKPTVELKGKAYVFEATLEAETKTVLDENTMQSLWMGDENENEYIAVLEQVLNTATEDVTDDYTTSVNKYVAKGIYEPTAEATFEMEEGGGAGITGKEVFAVYPYSPDHTCVVKTDVTALNVKYPDVQYAQEGTYDSQAAVAVAYNADVEASQDFAFKNVSALLKFSLNEDTAPVHKVTVYALGGEALSGAIVLKEEVKDGEKKRSISGAEKGALNYVELRAGKDEHDALEATETYYIAVAPATLKEGVGITINGGDKHTFTISKEIKFERSKIYDLGIFADETPAAEDWYVVGNQEDANLSDITKTRLEKVDNYFFRAAGVKIEAGKPFKFLNISTEESFYVKDEAVKARLLTPITVGEGYGTVEVSGTYDIYVSYNEDNGVIDFVNAYLVNLDSSNIPVPTHLKQMTWFDEDNYSDMLLALSKETVTIAAMGYDWMTEEPTGWEAVSVMNGSPTITPHDETSGDITWECSVYSSHFDDWTYQYYKIKYYNLTDDSIDILSVYMDEADDVEPVIDQNGEYISNATWTGMAIGSYDYSSGQNIAVTADILSEEVDIRIPSPEGKQIMFYDEYGTPLFLIDFGLTQQNQIIKATTTDGIIWNIDEVWAEDGFYVDAENPTTGTISWVEDGKKYTITYKNYSESMMGSAPEFRSDDVDEFEKGLYGAVQIMPYELSYPYPDNVQLSFLMLGQIPAVIDLGVNTSNHLVIALDWESHPMYAANPALEPFKEWYMIYGQSETGMAYEVIPTDATSGVIRATIPSIDDDTPTTIDYKYKDYAGKGEPFMIDAALAGDEDNDFVEVTPLDEPYRLFLYGVTPTPGTTPEGKQWIGYIEGVGQYSPSYDTVLDIGFTSVKTINYAYDYEGKNTYPSFGFGGAEEYIGKWIISDTYNGYTVTIKDEKSGTITMAVSTSYGDYHYKIEYSNYTGETVDIFSPYTFNTDDDDSVSWEGLGIGEYGEDGATPVPVEFTAVDPNDAIEIESL